MEKGTALKLCLKILYIILYYFWLMVAVKAQDISPCCSSAIGTCRTICEEVSIVKLALNQQTHDEVVESFQTYCPQGQEDLWKCMNKTLKDISSGRNWWGRTCCFLPRTPDCSYRCVTSNHSTSLRPACRPSDQLAFYECVDKMESAQECCSNTEHQVCHKACRDVFLNNGDRRQVEDACNIHSMAVITCVRKHIKANTIVEPMKYLPCCKESTKSSCRESCKRVLLTETTINDISRGLQNGGCGMPIPHDRFWQCFLNKESESDEKKDPDVLGVDSAKLHCCQKAVSPSCNKLCFDTFNNNWADNWKRFDVECLQHPFEANLTQCVEEVEAQCEAGCNALSYCTNFNGRSLELFRSCNVNADMWAHYQVNQWMKNRYLNFSGILLPIKNVSSCSLNIWKSIACTLQIRPCTKKKHTSLICTEDCYQLLTDCLDWSKVNDDVTPSNLCELLSAKSDECVSLNDFLRPDERELYTAVENRVTRPCSSNPCKAGQICQVYRNCKQSDHNCLHYKCIDGCPLGKLSQYIVPIGTYVRIPIGDTSKSCHKICQCTSSGRIENCQQMFCYYHDDCMIVNRRIAHGTSYYVECNRCVCVSGEQTCSRRVCAPRSSIRATPLPCYCPKPTQYEAVCADNTRTLPSHCLARCVGYSDNVISRNACSTRDSCDHSKCEWSTWCASRHTQCLSNMQTPCTQHKCLNITDCSEDNVDPVCDISGRTHRNICKMLMSGKSISYWGECIIGCNTTIPVCGVDGKTYESECIALSNYVSVDYIGACRTMGFISDAMSIKCDLNVGRCPRLYREDCVGFTPPGACCPKCGGAFRILYSKKQVDRVVFRLNSTSIQALNLKTVLSSLERHVKVLECVLRGYMTIENEIFVSIESSLRNPSEIQLGSCVTEAEKLISLINRRSALFQSELSLSPLVYAISVHTSYNGTSVRVSVSFVNFIVCLFVIFSIS